MGIVYITSADYIKYTKVSIVSLVTHCESKINFKLYVILTEQVDMCLFDDIIALIPNNIKFIIVLNLLDVKENRFNEICYMKFSIPRIIEDEDRLLYIDSDTIVIGDISELFSIDMMGMPLAAVKGKKAKWPYSKYGAGIILYNCEEYRKCDCEKKLLEEIPNIVFGADKYAFNKVLHEKISELPYRFNLSPEDYIAMRANAQKSNCIVHFWGTPKPWQENILASELWKQYERMLIGEEIEKAYCCGK